jgi:tetratricopeptide (TPR) repeat protein
MLNKLLNVVVICMAIFVGPLIVFAQAEKEGFALIKEAGQILKKAQSNSDMETALKKYENALNIFEKTGSDKGKGSALNNIGQVYFRLGQYSKSLEFYQKALSIKKKIGDTKGECYSINGIGLVYNAQSQYKKALEFFERYLEMSKAIRDISGEGSALNNIGMVSQSLGQYPKALEHYERSLEIKKELGDVSGEGTALSNIGHVYSALGQYPKAMECFDQSLEIRKKIGDVRGEANSLVNIGDVYRLLGQYPKALEHHERSLEIRKKIGDVRGEANSLVNIGLVYNALGKYSKALDYYNRSLEIDKKIGLVKGESDSRNNIGNIYCSQGQYPKALEYHEKSFEIRKKIGDVAGESSSLNNIGNVYLSLGQYPKALDCYERSIEIKKRIGDIRGEGLLLSNMGIIYRKLGQPSKALDYYKRSREIRKKIGDVEGEGTTYSLIGSLYAEMGKFADAQAALEKALGINKSIGKPIRGAENNLANFFLDCGDLFRAEALIKSSGYDSTRARLSLMKKDYDSAGKYYEKSVKTSEKTGNADGRFMSYTGLATAHEAMENYEKAEEYYEKAMNLLEEIRSGLLPSERKNFFEVKIGGFTRIEPAKGLTRVRMRLNRHDGAIKALEVTKARAFADHLSETSASGASGVPRETMEREQSLVNRFASLKKDLAKTDRAKQSGRYEILSRETQEAEADLSAFVDSLWKNNPAYAAVKYPRPIGIKDSALGPKECVVMFDVSSSGVMIKLIRDKKEAESFFKKWDSDDLEKQVKKFRAPFENRNLREFDPELAESLYRKLLQAVLVDVPKGTPLIIIPDGILAVLPFEALVTGGKANWEKVKDKNWPDQFAYYPTGITYLGDDHPISYYQSLSALTLVRNMGNKTKPKDNVLVLADPVFNLQDKRAQLAGQTRLAQKEREYNIKLMRAIEDSGGPTFKQLPETGILAESLMNMYGDNCLALTGIQADKSVFLSKIAPRIGEYGSIVFATHGVVSNKTVGLMEPFLALTMVPHGTDGFLRMSDILSLKMNADIVALTACQTGLGKEVSGEGVVSMGYAFQYSGAKSVLMSLWEVEASSAVILAENFFRYRKSGQTKLESLLKARNDLREAGYKHPFFWSGFILVGEAS